MSILISSILAVRVLWQAAIASSTSVVSAAGCSESEEVPAPSFGLLVFFLPTEFGELITSLCV